MTTHRPTSTPDTDHDSRRDALAGRLFEATLGAFDLLAIHLGSRLGLYDAMADGHPRTASEVANTIGITPRYAAEILEHQDRRRAGQGWTMSPPGRRRRYRLPSRPRREILADPTVPRR